MLTISTSPRDNSDAIDPAHDRALTAERAADWLAAEAFWRVVIARDTNRFVALRGLAAALRQQDRPEEAEAVLRTAAAHKAADIESLIAFTEYAELNQDAEEAARRWRAVRGRFPDDPRGYLGNAEVARFVLRFDEVTAVLREATQRFPREPVVWTRYAEWAETRGDWPEAERAWRGLLAMDETPPSRHVGLARAMLHQGRRVDADLLLARRREAQPGEAAYAIAHATVAEAVADWPSARLRWGEVLARFPDQAAGHAGIARSLRKLERTQEAGAALHDGLRRFPDDAGLLIESARLAHQAALTDVALLAWEELRSKYPDTREAYVEAAEILHQQGRLDDADALLSAATSRFQTDMTIWRARADLDRVRHELRSPASRIGDATTRAVKTPNGETPNGDPALRDLGFAFESLGGAGPAGGCEFGLVQLHFGANPLSLLRWASVSPASLIAALDARFQGIEDRDVADLFLVTEDPRDFWWVRDPRYGIQMHGFLSAKEVSREQALGPYRKRLRYLRDKLIGDLEAGEKIFVLKHADRRITPEEIDGVSRALHAFASVVVLCVCPTDADHAEGSLARHAANLWVGHIDFSDADDIDGRVPAWRLLCEAMVRARQSG